MGFGSPCNGSALESYFALEMLNWKCPKLKGAPVVAIQALGRVEVQVPQRLKNCPSLKKTIHIRVEEIAGEAKTVRERIELEHYSLLSQVTVVIPRGYVLTAPQGT